MKLANCTLMLGALRLSIIYLNFSLLLSGASGVTEYFDNHENPGLGPNFTEKVGPLTQKTSYFLLKY